ncbi:PQQ-binding-like beta-propeller repeat protein [bacterium]|nr:PQQ-binding-like beta-propeller repeat protein [bacterium]
MKPYSSRKLSGLVLSLCLLVASSASFAAEPTADWTSFRNGPLLHGVAGSGLPDELEIRWEYATSDGIPGTPAILDGSVYCGTLDGYVVRLDLKDGKEIWKTRSIDDPDPKSFAPGFKAAPLVNDGRVYIGDEDGIFHCLDAETGKQLWTFETFGEIISSATASGDRIIFGSYDNSLYCLNAESGEKVWSFETEGYVNCTPAVAEGFTFVTGCDEQLRVLEVETGKQVKEMPLNTYLIASPVVEGDYLYVGTYAAEVIAVNWKTMTVDWRYDGAIGEFPYHSSAALLKDRLVVGGRDKLIHCIDRKNGEGVWSFPTRGKVDSSPVIVGDRIFCGSDDGYLYELDLKTGEEQSKHRIGRKVPGSAAVGENSLVIGSAERNGKLFCFGAK